MENLSIFDLTPGGEQFKPEKSTDWKWRFSDYPREKNGLKVFSCFACGGGSTMGYKLAGCDVLGCVEIDPRMNEVYVRKEAQVVDGGQEGRLQSVVLAPMRATQRLLSGMNNATLAAIGSAEHLEQRAAEVRAAKAERTAERPGKRLTKKPSVRKDLE